MNTDRNKYLTEAMGGKVRTVTPKKREFNRVGGFKFKDFVCSCCDGPQSACGNYATDFSTWDGFGKLISFLDAEFSDKEIADILYLVAITGCVQNLPDKTANLAYEVLKGRES